MQPPGADPNPNRSFLAQLLMSIFNRGQPFQGAGGGGGSGNMFPAAPGSGMSGMFPQAPGGPPTDMSVAGPWGAGRGIPPDLEWTATPEQIASGTPIGGAPTPSPRPRRPGERLHPDRTVKAGPR